MKKTLNKKNFELFYMEAKNKEKDKKYVYPKSFKINEDLLMVSMGYSKDEYGIAEIFVFKGKGKISFRKHGDILYVYDSHDKERK